MHLVLLNLLTEKRYMLCLLHYLLLVLIQLVKIQHDALHDIFKLLLKNQLSYLRSWVLRSFNTALPARISLLTS